MQNINPSKYLEYALKLLCAFAIMLGLAMAMSGCIPSRKACEQAYGQCGLTHTDTIYKVKEKVLTVPGAFVETYIYDTLLTTDTLRISDASGVAVLQWYKDELGRVRARCTASERTITVLDTIVRIKSVKEAAIPCPPEKPSNWYWWLGGGFVFAIALPYIIKLIRKLTIGI